MTQPFVPGYGPAIPPPTPGVDVQDEGVPIPGPTQTLNFVGAGVSAAPGAPGTVDVTIPAAPGEALTWSPVDYWLAKASALLSQDAGNYTSGNAFDVVRQVEVSGARFYWHGGARTIRVRLWDPTGASLASVDVVVPGPGIYTALFGAPVIITTVGPSNSKYTISYYDLSGASQYTRIAANAYAIAPGAASWPTVNWIARSVVMGFYRGYYNPATGDSFPGSEIGNTYLIEPLIVD